jgi:WD40 repeat protein
MQLLKGQQSRIRCLAFSPDGSLLASAAGKGKSISLWDLGRGRRLGFLSGHQARIKCLGFAPAPGGPLASAATYDPVRLWDPGSRELRASLPTQGPHHGLAFSANGRALAVASSGWRGYGVSLWDVEERRQQASLAGPTVAAWSLAFAPDGRSLAVGGDTTADLWDLDAGRVRARLPHASPVRSLAYSLDGSTLAAASGRAVTLWDVASGKARAVLKGHVRLVNAVAYTPDGRTLASAGNDGRLRLWDAGSGKERANFDWQVGPVYAVAFAPDAMRARGRRRGRHRQRGPGAARTGAAPFEDLGRLRIRQRRRPAR